MSTLYVSWYGHGLHHINSGSIDWVNTPIKVALMAGSFVPNQNADQFFSELNNEATGSGYVSGGKSLTGRTRVYDPNNLRVILDANDISWDQITITARYMVIYADGVAGVDDYVIAYGDAGSEQSAASTTFTIQWDASGILQTTAKEHDDT